MNIYLIASIILSLILFTLLLINLSGGVDYDKFVEKFEQLDDESKEEILQLMERTVEKNKQARERRYKFFAKIISSNVWIFTITMSFLWRWVFTEEEKESYKSYVREKYPHLQDAIDDEEDPPSKP